MVEATAGLLAPFDRPARPIHSTCSAMRWFTGFSLYVLRRSSEWKIKAALVKDSIIALFGLGVLFELIHKIVSGVVPSAEVMGFIGALVPQKRFDSPERIFCRIAVAQIAVFDLEGS